MTILLSELERIIREAEPLLLGRVVLGFRDAGLDTFFLYLGSSGGEEESVLKVLLCLRRGMDRAHLTWRRSPRKNRIQETAFARHVDASLKGAALSRFWTGGDDRIVQIAFQVPPPPQEHILIAELIGRHANLLLIDEQGLIKDSLREYHGKSRVIERGGPYRPLPAPRERMDREMRFYADPESRGPAPLNEAADRFFQAREEERDIEELRKRLIDRLARLQKKAVERMARLEEQLNRAHGADRFRESGDLLKTSFPLLKKGLQSIEVENPFSDKGEKVVIPLDPALSPQENIAAYYRRYKKARDGIGPLSSRIDGCARELDEIAALLEHVRCAEGEAALEAIETRLTPSPRRAAPSGANARSRSPVPGERSFLSSDGLTILVGKDGPSNERLTFRIARGNDIWMHAVDAAGSHVIVRKEGKKSVPLNSLIDAGHLAVHFSKKRGADKAEVRYTEKKYVRKPRGAPPGKVIVERSKTLFIASDPDRLRRLLAGADKPPTP